MIFITSRYYFVLLLLAIPSTAQPRPQLRQSFQVFRFDDGLRFSFVYINFYPINFYLKCIFISFYLYPPGSLRGSKISIVTSLQVLGGTVVFYFLGWNQFRRKSGLAINIRDLFWWRKRKWSLRTRIFWSRKNWSPPDPSGTDLESGRLSGGKSGPGGVEIWLVPRENFRLVIGITSPRK